MEILFLHFCQIPNLILNIYCSHVNREINYAYNDKSQCSNRLIYVRAVTTSNRGSPKCVNSYSDLLKKRKSLKVFILHGLKRQSIISHSLQVPQLISFVRLYKKKFVAYKKNGVHWFSVVMLHWLSLSVDGTLFPTLLWSQLEIITCLSLSLFRKIRIRKRERSGWNSANCSGGSSEAWRELLLACL